ncbi:Hypothetical protein Minf_0145 [Methylacidiphilum infernorum V4]|uniref:Uncharacterized protein n=1 Tax=Methylacidiphilum infernorum (isolate V4) TaxID=481448 RepID=B3DXH1_METI4|nr:Hypothetical protein Minf_0145 [Methylacidiphilum infernorum V4]
MAEKERELKILTEFLKGKRARFQAVVILRSTKRIRSTWVIRLFFLVLVPSY